MVVVAVEAPGVASQWKVAGERMPPEVHLRHRLDSPESGGEEDLRGWVERREA